MKITIYQINSDRDTKRIKFVPLDRLKDVQNNEAVDSKLYDKIYENEMELKNLEDVYYTFNMKKPSDFKGHSLSVSDVVEISECENLDDGFYFCDRIGFKKIDFDNEKCIQNEKQNKLKVLLVEPNKYPKVIEIDDKLEAMQKLVGGNIEEYIPFDDGTAIICNDEGLINHLPPNRAVYSEPIAKEMTYQQLKDFFYDSEEKGTHAMGYIVFTENSFQKKYTEEERTYVVSSNNKAFIPDMSGYSIYASSLDGADRNVRIEQYMKDEYGNSGNWEIEKCYIKDDSNKEIKNIIFGKFFVCYAPPESEKFESLPDNLAKKYAEKFKYPERFLRRGNEISAIPFEPKVKEYSR